MNERARSAVQKRRSSTALSPTRISSTSRYQSNVITCSTTSHYSRTINKNKTNVQLPALQQSNSASSFKKCFQLVLSASSQFMAHNCSIHKLKALISNQSIAEIEKLFYAFAQSLLNANINNSNPKSLQSNGLSFLKCWKLFVLTFLEVYKTGEILIKNTIISLFDAINESIDEIQLINDKIRHPDQSKGEIHDLVVKSCKQFKNSLKLVSHTIFDVFFTSETNQTTDELKNICKDIKNFSRNINEAFLHEFSQIGLQDSMKIRTITVSSCADIIRGLRASSFFKDDLDEIFKAIDFFQKNLREVCEKNDLPFDFLIDVSAFLMGDINQPNSLSMKPNENSEGGDDDDDDLEDDLLALFDEDMDIPEFILRYQNILSSKKINDKKSFIIWTKFFDGLNSKVNILYSEQDFLRSQLSTLQAENNQIKDENSKMNEIVISKAKDNEEKDGKIEKMTFELENITNKEVINQESQTETDNTFFEEKIREKNIIKNFRNSLLSILNNEDENNINDSNEEEDNVLICKVKDLYHENQMEIKSLKEKISLLKNENERKLGENENCMKEKDDEISQIKNSLSFISRKDNIDEKIEDLKLSFTELIKLKVFKNLADENLSGLLSNFISLIKEIVLEITKIKGIIDIGQTEDINCSEIASYINQIGNIIGAIDLAVIRNNEINKNKDTNNSVVLLESELVKKVKEITRINSEYTNGYNKILEILNLPHDISDSKQTVDKLAIEAVNILKEKIEKFSHLNSSTDSNPNVYNILDASYDNISNLQNQLKSAENAIFKNMPEINESQQKRNLVDYVEILIKKIYQSKKDENKNKEKDEINLNTLKKLHSRLCKVLGVESVNDNEITSHVFQLLETTENRLNKFDSFLNDLVSKLNLKKSSSFDEIIKKIDPSQNITFAEADQIFCKIFDLVPVTTRNDARIYLPEIVSSFQGLHFSIFCLKPFATILNKIFSEFDAHNLNHFRPKSPEFKLLKDQMYEIHSSLNALSPTKVNSLVFVVLSKFVSLMSSFSAAISSACWDFNEDDRKSIFENLQNDSC